METSYAQPNKFLNGFQNIQNAMMSTASKKNISNHKSQFMRKIKLVCMRTCLFA